MLSRHDEFVLREYDSAVKLTYQIDELRNKVTSFFYTMATGAAAAVALLMPAGSSATPSTVSESIVALFLVGLSVAGVMFVAVLARLRRVQLEHFGIINGIREFFLGKIDKTNVEAWNAVRLSARTLPKVNRGSGTYFWLLGILLVNAGLIALAAYLRVRHLNQFLGGHLARARRDTWFASLGVLAPG